MKPLAFISGATGAIGEAAAERLASSYRLLLHYHQNHDKAMELQQRLHSRTEVYLMQADFKDGEAALKAIEPYADEIKLLVHNAGISRPEVFQLTSDIMLEEEMAIGLVTPAKITKRILSPMLAAKEGTIIFVSSIWGETGAAMEVIYSTVKSAQHGFVKALAKETAVSGVKINAVAPGAVDTAMLDGYTKDEIQSLLDDIPVNRLAAPGEIADCIAFLAGDSSSYVHGHILSVNGGWYT